MKEKLKKYERFYNPEGFEIFDTNTDMEDMMFHGTPDFPIATYATQLSKLIYQHTPPHWHKEIQLLYVLEGKARFMVNNNNYEITKGDGLFINSGCIHGVYKIEPYDCVYVSINVGTNIFVSKENYIYTQYLLPFFTAQELNSILLTTSTSWQCDILDTLKDIYSSSKENIRADAFGNYKSIHNIVFSLITNTASATKRSVSYKKEDEIRVRNMIIYMRKNYMEKITLSDLANVNNISKAECCRSFKRVINISPFEYLISYRINESIVLLQTTGLNITEIALEVGFSSTSYYIECFKRHTGFTPGDLRRKER